MQAVGVGQLCDLADGKRQLEEIRFARPIRRENNGFLVGRERVIQEVEIDVDAGMIRELMNGRAGLFVTQLSGFRWKRRALAELCHALSITAVIQTNQSGKRVWADSTTLRIAGD